MASSTFHILLNGSMIERTYSGTPAEQFAAYKAEFPIGSGRYCRDNEPAIPLVVFG